MKIKIFKGNYYDDLQKEVNGWMASKQRRARLDKPFKVLSVSQSESVKPSDPGYEAVWSLTITVFYKEGR